MYKNKQLYGTIFDGALPADYGDPIEISISENEILGLALSATATFKLEVSLDGENFVQTNTEESTSGAVTLSPAEYTGSGLHVFKDLPGNNVRLYLKGSGSCSVQAASMSR